MSIVYPTLRIGVLRALENLQDNFSSNENFLHGDDCPYDKETVVVLEKLLRPKVVEVERVVEKLVRADSAGGKGGGAGGLTREDQEMVETELADVLRELREMGKREEGERDLDQDTKLKIMKAKTTLIEQIIKLRERTFNVKRISTFEKVVVGILDDLVSEDGRAEFITRVEPYAENEG